MCVTVEGERESKINLIDLHLEEREKKSVNYKRSGPPSEDSDTRSGKIYIDFESVFGIQKFTLKTGHADWVSRKRLENLAH